MQNFDEFGMVLLAGMTRLTFVCNKCMKVTTTTNKEVFKNGICFKCRLNR